jgi:myo-inositol 2-dehydrogenase/D-chiro-inositol 1-dehydrogenase
MARFLLGGDEPVIVQALGSVLTDPAIKPTGDVDTAAVQMQTASGKIVVITNSRRASYGYDQRIEVHGSKGMLRAGNVHMTTVERAGGDGFVSDVIQNFFIDRYVAAYAAELNTFIDAVEKGTRPVPGGTDGLMASRLADAATESRKTGQPVRLG